MSMMRTLGTGTLGAEKPLARIREWMEVEHASAERFGRVLVDVGSAQSVPAELTEDWLQVGCKKIDTNLKMREWNRCAVATVLS